jgi:nucleoside diphosphate kinase
MQTLCQLLEIDQLGLTIYLPECAQSRLWGNLDHAIHEATGYEPVFRRWIIHDYNSVMRFYVEGDDEIPQTDDLQAAARKYDNIPADELQYGHLVVKLLLMGPSLLTLWRGDNAIAELLTLKGATHPAEATKSSIRGRFRRCKRNLCAVLCGIDSACVALSILADCPPYHELLCGGYGRCQQ